MNRGFAYIDEHPKRMPRFRSKRQCFTAIRVIIAHLERLRDAERRQMCTAWRYEAELIASIIDEAIWILDTIQ